MCVLYMLYCKNYLEQSLNLLHYFHVYITVGNTFREFLMSLQKRDKGDGTSHSQFSYFSFLKVNGCLELQLAILQPCEKY